MKTKVALLVFAIAFGSMALAQKSKKQVSWDKLDALVENKDFRIESTWARAQADTSIDAIATSGLQNPGSTGNRFNLIGNFNFFEMKGDTVSAYLPYFGQRQFGNGHYKDNGAIDFNGVPKNLKIEKNEKKKRYEIEFNMDRDTETLQVFVYLYPSMKTLITVNSTQRFIIRYDGDIVKKTKKDKAGTK